jgi:hypothetical protein
MIAHWPRAASTQAATPLRIIQLQVMRPAGGPDRAPFRTLPTARWTRRIALAFAFVLAAGALSAQPSQPAANSEAFGFSYHLPSDWQVAPDKSALPAARENAEQSAKSPGQVLSVACAQVVLSAQNGKPPSVVVISALPFACYGQPMTAKDLPHFAAGVSDGLRQNFNVTNPVYGAYALGTHNFWIERAVGIPKNRPGAVYTLEIACTVLKESAVCWMTLANSATALRDFEQGVVKLDGEPPMVLVPINAFVKNPP